MIWIINESNNQYVNSERSSVRLLKSCKDSLAEEDILGGDNHKISVIYVSCRQLDLLLSC